MNTEVKELGQLADHNYAVEVTTVNKRNDSAPTTPSKIPVGKKSKPASMEGEISNLTILEAIQSMEKTFNEQLLELREQSKQSSCMIASLAKAVQYNADEVKDCKGKISELKSATNVCAKTTKSLKRESGSKRDIR